MAQALAFFGVALSVVGIIHYYLWRRLVHDTTRPGRARRVGTLILLALVAVLVVSLVGFRVLPHYVAGVFAWPGYLWLAVMFYLLLVLAVLELPRFVARRVMRRRARPASADKTASADKSASVDEAASADKSASVDEAAPADKSASVDEAAPAGETETSRRLLLARSAAIAAGLVAVGVTGSGVRVAMGPPRLKRLQIPLAKLPASADGLRVALVSDIHLGPLRGASDTRRIVDLINGLDPDLVAIVGDLVDGSVAELGDAVQPLRQLHSRLGAFFVTGNHEYYSGYQEWVDEVATLGVRPLRNERIELPGGVDLIGVNDATAGTFGDAPDYDKAFAGRDPSRPAVVLAHQPIQAHEAAARGADLQLSGHTHGGQVWPFHYLVRLQQPVVSGLATVDGMPVYVTNGAGFWGPPARVGAPPDITLVQLRRS